MPVKIFRVTQFNDSTSIERLAQAVADRNVDIVNFQWLITSAADNPRGVLGSFAPVVLERMVGVPTTVTMHHTVHTMDLEAGQKVNGTVSKIKVVAGSELIERSLQMVSQVYVMLDRYVDAYRDIYDVQARRMHHGFFQLKPIKAQRFGDLTPEGQQTVFIGSVGKWGDYKLVQDQVAGLQAMFSQHPNLKGKSEGLLGGGDNPNAIGYTAQTEQYYRTHPQEGVLVITGREVADAIRRGEIKAGDTDSYRQWITDQAQKAGVNIVYRAGFIEDDEFAPLNDAYDISLLLYRSTTGTSGPAHEAAGIGGTPIVASLQDARYDDMGDLAEEGLKINGVPTREKRGPHGEKVLEPDAAACGRMLAELVLNPALRLEQAKQNYEAGKNLVPAKIGMQYYTDFRRLLGMDAQDTVVGKLAKGAELRAPPAGPRFWLQFVGFFFTRLVPRILAAGISSIQYARGQIRKITMTGGNFAPAWQEHSQQVAVRSRVRSFLGITGLVFGLSGLAYLVLGSEGQAQLLTWISRVFVNLQAWFAHYDASYRIGLTTAMAVFGNAIQDFVGQKLGKRPQYNWKQTLSAALLGATVGVQIALLNIFIDWSLPKTGLINSGLLKLYNMNGFFSNVGGVFIQALRGLAVPMFGLLISLEYGFLTMIFGKDLKKYTVKDQALKAVDFNAVKAPFALVWGYINQNIVRSTLRGPFQIVYDMAWGFVQAWAFNRGEPLRYSIKRLLFTLTKNQRFAPDDHQIAELADFNLDMLRSDRFSRILSEAAISSSDQTQNRLAVSLVLDREGRIMAMGNDQELPRSIRRKLNNGAYSTAGFRIKMSPIIKGNAFEFYGPSGQAVLNAIQLQVMQAVEAEP